jgi:hypothetical protein
MRLVLGAGVGWGKLEKASGVDNRAVLRRMKTIG